MSVKHIPVLLKEVSSILNPQDGKIYVDATFGGGGHSEIIVKQANCTLIAIDQDIKTYQHYEFLKDKFNSNMYFFNDTFSNLDKILESLMITKIDGILFDLGISSMQISGDDRGFSFYIDQPLDMRMNQSIKLTAAEVVNHYSEKDLANIIFYYGGEKRSRSIAKNIVHNRRKNRILTTFDLIEVIRSSVEKYYIKSHIHFATKTFQALRICVNNELETIHKTLEKLPKYIAHNGVVLAISFHSLEDRIVKRHFKSYCTGPFHNITKKVIIPEHSEINKNRRCRSSKLRAVRRV